MELSLVTDGKATRCFEPCGAFKGAKPGWVFKTGGQGLGYYLDALDDSFEQSFRQSKQETSYLFELAERGHFDRLTSLLQDFPHFWQAAEDDGTTLLHWAAVRDDAKFVSQALAVKIAVDVPGPRNQTPLMWAAAGGAVSVMHALITAQADVNAKDESGATPLLHAVQHKQQTSLLRLVAVAENETELPRLVSVTDNKGRNGAHWAAYLGDLSSLKLLSHFGDNLHHLDEKRNTALHQAVAGCRPGVLDFLVNRGVDPELHNADGATCVDLARDHSHAETTSALQRLLKPKGIDVHELAESGAAPFKKKQESGSAKDPMQLLKQYGFGVFWLMCVSITVFEYILDSQILAEQYCPVLAAIFERGVFFSLVLFFSIVLGDPGKVTAKIGARPNGLDAYLRLLREGVPVEATRLCTTTWLLKDLRTKYDIWSGACIQEFDHFCNFTGCVIGRNNHRRFIILATIEPLTQLCYIGISAVVAYRDIGFPHDLDEIFWLPYNMAVMFPTAVMTYPLMTVVTLVNMGTSAMVFQLLAQQATLISLNWTVNETMNADRYSHMWVKDACGNRSKKSPFNKGDVLENWKDFWWGRQRADVGPNCPDHIRQLATALKKAGAV